MCIRDRLEPGHVRARVQAAPVAAQADVGCAATIVGAAPPPPGGLLPPGGDPPPEGGGLSRRPTARGPTQPTMAHLLRIG
eukprot:10953709-Alexandrium_andersonii.AAC.1